MDPSFFKPLIGDFPQKLLIPPAFVERMEGKLGSNLVLKYECERLYTVQVEKLEQGRFFFVNGWPQFVTDHGLEYGDFIVFRLIEDSAFQVTVYDPSMCEKNCCDSHQNKNVDQTAMQAIKVEENTSSHTDLTEKNEEIDVKMESDDEPKEPSSNTDAPSFQLLLNEANKMYLPLPPLFVRKSGLAKKREIKLRDPNGKKWPVKIIKEGKKTALTREWTGFFLAHRLKKGDTCIFTFVRRDGTGIIQVDVKRGRGRPPRNGSKKTKAKEADNVHKDRALAVANAFKSKNPFFVHVMKESHIVGGGWPNVYIPKTFREAHKNWQSNDKLILDVEGGSWVAFCNLNLDCNQCRISRGWTIFARDNSLNVGDVCVFELINRSSKRFKVFISRAAKETNFEENERLPRVRSEADKARVLELVKAYKPNHPFFKVKVHRSYLYGGSMTVPMEFINAHITEDSCRVVLQLSDGRVWPVKCYINNKCAKFSAGWKSFSTENDLAVGDFCCFELVNQSLLKVVIFRVES